MFKYAYTFGLLKQLVKDVRSSGGNIVRRGTLAQIDSPSFNTVTKNIHIPKKINQGVKDMGGNFPTLLHETGHLLDKDLKARPDFIHPLGQIADEFTANSNAVHWLQNNNGGQFVNRFQKDISPGINNYKRNRILSQANRILDKPTRESMSNTVGKVETQLHLNHPEIANSTAKSDDVMWRSLKRDPKVRKVISHISRNDKLVQYSPIGPKDVVGNPTMGNM